MKLADGSQLMQSSDLLHRLCTVCKVRPERGNSPLPRDPDLTLDPLLSICDTDHYPERLGTAFVINLPFLIRGFFSSQ